MCSQTPAISGGTELPPSCLRNDDLDDRYFCFVVLGTKSSSLTETSHAAIKQKLAPPVVPLLLIDHSGSGGG
jgi:hypothetical protein